MLWCVCLQSVQAKARTCAYSPSGTQLAVGLYSGDLVVLSDDLTKVLAQVRDLLIHHLIVYLKL